MKKILLTTAVIAATATTSFANVLDGLGVTIVGGVSTAKYLSSAEVCRDTYIKILESNGFSTANYWNSTDGMYVFENINVVCVNLLDQ